MAQQTFEEIADAVKQAESRGKRYAADGKTLTTSPKGALGEMQVMPKTIRDPGFGVVPAKDKSPDEIARVGRDYLQAMLGKYGDTEKALIAYNWGPGVTDKWLASGANPEKLPAETRTYVQRVNRFLGKDVPRETTVVKKEREPLPESLPPMAQADIKTPSVKPEAAARVASLGPGYQAALALSFLADTDDEEDRKTTITQEFMAKAQEEEDAQAAAVAARTRQANVFADLSNTTIRSPFAQPQQPVRMKEGGEVEDLTKPSFGNPNIRKQGEAARRLAAMRDVNTLPDPKTYAAVAGALGTRPDQMGFSVLNPKYKEIMDVANPAFYAGTALQIAPVAQGPGMGRMVGAAERALEPAVRRTLEGGGKAAQMLQALAAPPSQMFVRARPEAAARHADLQAQGLSPEQIRAQNLTLVDNRGNLLEEISDAPAVLQQKTASVPRMYYDMLKHPELQSIYPAYDMPDVRIGTTRRKDAPLAAASFDEREGIQGTVRSLPGDDVGGMVRGTLLHEGQHAIQSIEGFTEGANPSSFVAYIKARRGTYDSDPTVNENVIRGMERIYPNLPEVTDRIGEDLKARYGKVFPSDRRVGEALYRHMPGEVQADLARIRSNLTPDELKATPLEASMQQLNINPANILEMNKGGSRLDRQIGDLEYDVYGYADGGEVDMEGQEIKFATGQPQAPTSAPLPPATRSAKELDAYIKALNPGAKISYFPEGGEGGGVYGYVSSKAQDILNIQRGLSPRSDEEVKLHELEHSLGFRGGDPLGRPKISKVDNNYKAYYMLGDWRPMSQFTQNMVDNREKLEKFFGRPLNDAYFKPETLEVVRKQHGDTSALFDEQTATLSALEQITGKSLTRDPEMKKLFPNVRVMSVYDALTGPRQTRLDARDLPPSTPQPAYTYRDNPVTKFLHKNLLGDNFYPYQKPVRRADGSPEEGERLTPQQIERLAAQEVAEREAASTPAFIAQKSGIGRKAGPVSQALQSGQGQIEFLKGMTNIPQNLVGAPMDISNMIANVYGGGVEKPFMGSDYIKEGLRARGLGFTPSTDPTLAAFYGAGDLGSNFVNPAGLTRTGVRAAGAVAEKAGEAARDFQQYNQQLAVPGASYAVRNKGTLVPMSGFFGLPTQDQATIVVNNVINDVKQLHTLDKPLTNWFQKTVTRYLRSDFASPDDQLVKAAEKGQLLHLAPKDFSDSASDQVLKKFLERRQSELEYMRQAEGFGNTNMATQPYGQRIEDLTDISAYPERVGDLTPNRVPPSMRNIVETRPETRVTDFAPGIVRNLKLDELRDKMLDVRQSDGKYGAYGQPEVKIPAEYLLPDSILVQQSVAAASNRMAKYTNWQDDTRQRMATTSLREDPRFTRAPLQDGKYLGVALPDVRQNPEVKQLVLDVGCDGGWCTRYSQNAKSYGSGDSRLHIMVTGEGKKARPVAQFAIVDSGLTPVDGSSGRFYIKEIKEKGNTTDFKNNPALPAIQEYVKFLDKSYGGLDSVDELSGLNMVNMREELRFPSMPHSKGEYSSQGLLDKLLKVNGNSYYASKDEFPTLIKKANELPNNAARQIQMNLFQPPKEKATGGMMERQPNDNRRYL